MPKNNPKFATARMAQIDMLIPTLEAEVAQIEGRSRAINNSTQEAMARQCDAYRADVRQLEQEFLELGGVKYTRKK